VPANLVPLFSSIKSGLALSNAQSGFAIAAGPIGALSSGLLAGMLIRRFRSSRVAVAGMIVASVCALLAGIAPSWRYWLPRCSCCCRDSAPAPASPC
jgi:MFS family permease